MSELLKKLNKKKLTLIVSLPENSPELAKAAIAGGAEALKVHINIYHKASGVEFGYWLQEKRDLLEIMKIAKGKVPVGIVPGEKVHASEDDIDEVVRAGFDFIDMSLEYCPSFMLQNNEIVKMLAVNDKYTIDKLFSIERLGADILEAAIVPSNQYGERMNIGDLNHYINIAMASSVPVVVPTQKNILPEEVPSLSDAGVKGLMIGAIVTGKTKDSIKKATALYRAAVDRV